MKLRSGRPLAGLAAATLAACSLTLPAATANAAPAWPLDSYTADDMKVATIDRTSRDAVDDSFQVLLGAFRTPLTWSGTTSGCVPGSLNEAGQHAAFDTVNWYRAMAGYAPVVEDTSLSQTAQAWALAAQAGAVFKHRPSADAGDNLGTCWSDAAYAASSGNLAGDPGAKAVVAFIDERSNVTSNPNAIIAHRGSVLDPRVATFGFGASKNWSSLLHGPYGQDSATSDMWPPAGYFPAQVLTPLWHYAPRSPEARFDNATVSVTRNGTPLSGVRVVLNAAGGPLVWTLPNSELLSLPTSDVTYRVTIAGLRRFSDGKAMPDVTYEVTAFTASGAAKPLLEGRLPNENPTLVADPVISGTPRVGSQLTVSNGTWSNVAQDATYAYQWFRSKTVAMQESWAEIDGATSNTYTPVDTDEGRTLFVQVTISSASSTMTAESGQVTVAAAAPATAPVSTARPKVSGSAKVGSTLTGSAGGWTANYPLTYAYQWFRDGATISGATKTTYKVTTSDAGRKLSLRVTATSAGKSATATSSATSTVPRYATIKGTVKVGKKVTVSKYGFPSGYRYSYRWYINGKSISGATKSSYTVTSSRAGKYLTVKVTAKKSGKSTLTATASKVKVAYGTLTAATPKISGTVKVGKTVKVSRGTWSSKVSFSYRWYANGKAVSGATKSSYKIPKSLAGKTLTVKVTGKRSGYTTVSKTSAGKLVG